jgi:Na+/phosphate symporter
MDTFNGYLKKMCDNMNNASECLTLLHSALTHNSTDPIHDCRERLSSIKKIETDLADKITYLARKDHSYKIYISVPQLLLRIGENIEKLSENLGKKIKEDILFSDRAISELAILFQKLEETLKSTSDLLSTKNSVLVQHINECEKDIVQKALEFATLHEERLVEGLCLPVSSSLYLNMLNSIRCIAWDAKEIATKFALN